MYSENAIQQSAYRLDEAVFPMDDGISYLPELSELFWDHVLLIKKQDQSLKMSTVGVGHDENTCA